MTTATFDNPYDRPSLTKRIAMPVLYALYRVLPRRVYEAIYHPGFRFYKRTLRARYRSRLELARRRADGSTVACMECVHSVMDYSLVGAPGLEHTYRLAAEMVGSRVPGAFVECGVAQGGCAALIAQVAASDRHSRKCWFFDSYEGLPDPTEDDYDGGKTGRHVRPLPKGSCLGTYEQVSALLFDHFRLARENIDLVKGWFQDTLPVTKTRIGPIALLRIDGDWYESTKCCLDELYPQVSPGAHVIIDDYCSCYGARRATDEYLANRHIETQLVPDGRGGASFQKPRTSNVRAA